jgi:hypothetical protein
MNNVVIVRRLVKFFDGSSESGNVTGTVDQRNLALTVPVRLFGTSTYLSYEFDLEP